MEIPVSVMRADLSGLHQENNWRTRLLSLDLEVLPPRCSTSYLLDENIGGPFDAGEIETRQAYVAVPVARRTAVLMYSGA
jgi:hypothetical protein